MMISCNFLKLFISILFVFSNSFYNGKALGTPLSLGIISKSQGNLWRGCLYEVGLCEGESPCVDDGLFGLCSPTLPYSPSMTLSSLSHTQLSFMRVVLAALVKEDFTWRSPFTQCVLNEVLGAFEQGTLPELEVCDYDSYLPEMPDIGGEVDDTGDIAEELLALNDYIKQLQDEVSSTGKQKKDEVVQVHKYFFDSPNSKTDAVRDDGYDMQQDYPESYERGAEIDPTALSYKEWQQLRNLLEGERNEGIDPAGIDDDIPDEDLLRGLLVGSVDVNDLSLSQTARMFDVVSSILESLQTQRYQSVKDGAESELVESSDEGEEASDLGERIDEISLEGEDRVGRDDDAPRVDEIPDDADESNGGNELNLNDRSDGLAKFFVSKSVGSEPLEQPIEKKAAVDSENLPTSKEVSTASPDPKRYSAIDTNFLYIEAVKPFDDVSSGAVINFIQKKMNASSVVYIDDVRYDNVRLNFRVDPTLSSGVNASAVLKFLDSHQAELQREAGITIVEMGNGIQGASVPVVSGRSHRQILITLIVCGIVLGSVIAVVAVHLIRRQERRRDKLVSDVSSADKAGVVPTASSTDYQDLCRQRMAAKSTEKPEPLHIASRIGSASDSNPKSPSSRSSTSSWSEEPAANNMDITTGHMVLSYMEDHLKNKDRLESEWQGLQAYEADPSATTHAQGAENMTKNRYSDVLPFDHSRVALNARTNSSGSDYINASSITDHDPRNPAYIVTQGALPHTVADLWQLVWEQGSLVIVCLTRLTEEGVAMCQRYWPEQGSEVYHIYEVHLVSEHIWCDDYLVRSFYLKNLETGETRTVTQFHYVSWPDLGVPTCPRALLDFRRKVNRSYKGRSCPVMVHCSDGCGRSGTYVLLDMVLNRMAKGAKEIDIAATLEHIRDQRMDMVKTKDQFEFVLMAIAEEVQAILKAIPQ